MKLISYKKALAMTKEAVDAAMVPIRARQVKKQAELEMSKLDEKILTLEVEVQELTTKHPLDFDKLFEKSDKIALLERRKRQFDKVLSELFPDVEAE
jgi:hypothetical protein